GRRGARRGRAPAARRWLRGDVGGIDRPRARRRAELRVLVLPVEGPSFRRRAAADPRPHAGGEATRPQGPAAAGAVVHGSPLRLLAVAGDPAGAGRAIG